MNLFITDILSSIEQKAKTVGDLTISDLYRICQNFSKKDRKTEENCEGCALYSFCESMDLVDETKKRFLPTPETQALLSVKINETFSNAIYQIKELCEFSDKLNGLSTLGYTWLTRENNDKIMAWKLRPAFDSSKMVFYNLTGEELPPDYTMVFMCIYEGDNEYLHKLEKLNIEETSKKLGSLLENYFSPG